MKVQIVILLMVSGLSLSDQEIRSEISAQIDRGSCKPHENLINQYRSSYYDYLTVIYKLLSAHSNVNFVFSANSLWLALAAMAEGADSPTKQQLFEFLSLPEDWCIRQEYYKLGRERILPGNNIDIKSASVLVVDESLAVNSHWDNLISNYSLLRVLDLPIKSDPEISIKTMEQIMSVPLDRLNLTGNSVLLDAVDYNGLWKTAFADAVVERSPFYNSQGEQIGYVDLMRMKKRVRMNYVSASKGTILELPVGSDGRYRMIFSTFGSTVNVLSTVMTLSKELVFYMYDNLQETDEPIDIAVPRVTITSRIDFRRILEGVGIKRVWNEEAATRSISEPAAFPSSFVQHASMILSTGGVEPAPEQPYVPLTNITNGFVGNKPFLFALYDSKTYTCLIAAGFSQPTYPN